MAARRLCGVFAVRTSDGLRRLLSSKHGVNRATAVRIAEGAVEALRVAYNGDRYQDALHVVVAEVVRHDARDVWRDVWQDGRALRAGDAGSNTHIAPCVTPATGGAP